MDPAGTPKIEPLFEAIVAHSTDSIMVLDLDAKIRFINRTAPGLTVADVVGRSIFEFVSDDQHAHMRRCFAEVIATGKAGRYESVYPIGPDVVTRWESRVGPIRSGDVTTGLVVFATDVTARTTASEERDRVFDLSADLLCVVRFDGCFARVNPAFVRTLGYTEDEILSTPLLALVHPDDRATTAARFERAVAAGDRVDAFENRCVCKDGTARLLQWTAQSDPVSKRVVAVGRDVTDERALEGQLRHSQKMDAVGQLAGGVAHDFNNLIQAILGNAQCIRDAESGEGASDQARRSHVDDILAAAARASSLTRQLLAFGRRSPLDVVVVDVGAMIRDLVQLMRRVIPENIRVDVATDPALWPVEGDRGQLEQVVMNLCINARDAMPGGGRLGITARNLERPAASVDGRAPAGRGGRYVCVTVTDTGEGMAPEVRERIFEPFFTTKSVGEGSGLGLAVAYGIVQQHDASLRVDSELGRGTSFELCLPAGAGVAAAAPSVGTPPRSATGGTETILIAEDEPLVRRLLVRVLRRAGYRVLAAANGAEAVALGRGEETIDLALLDVIMPGLSGPEVHQHLQAMRPGLPTLFVTGYSDASRSAHRIPADATVLGKPFELDDVLLRVRALLDRRAR